MKGSYLCAQDTLLNQTKKNLTLAFLWGEEVGSKQNELINFIDC